MNRRYMCQNFILLRKDSIRETTQPTHFPDIWLTSPNSTLDYVVVGVDPATRSTFRLKTVDNSSVGLAFCQYSKKIFR